MTAPDTVRIGGAGHARQRPGGVARVHLPDLGTRVAAGQPVGVGHATSMAVARTRADYTELTEQG